MRSIRALALAVFAGLLALVVLPPPALGQEQNVKPYVMLLLDSSGSMMWDICHSEGIGTFVSGGDNSQECLGNDVPCVDWQTVCYPWPFCTPQLMDLGCDTMGCNNGVPDDSRMFKVKKGASSVVSTFGEVTFGLARFHQERHDFACTEGGRDGGGWRGAPNSCDDDAMGVGWNQADVLVGFSDANVETILSWMNNCDDFPSEGDCPGTLPDGNDTCSICPASECDGGCDLELRPGGFTPLAGSLHDLRTGYLQSVYNGDAPELRDCRPYKVIMLTDGQDNCPGDPGSCSAPGNCSGESYELFSGAVSGKSIPVHVIGFAASELKDDLDQIAQAGGTDEAVIVDDEVGLALAMAEIISESLLVEQCNGQDDDCDGLCDESFPQVAIPGAPDCSNGPRAAQTCEAGIGACRRSGIYVCDGLNGVRCNAVPGPAGPLEICDNNIDDDCDGLVDENCGVCVPQAEVCDGEDNDCDGDVDEDYVSTQCGSDIGACEFGGTACVAGGVVCQGGTGPSPEKCDNIDNNCDTVVDGFFEACYPPSTDGCTYDTTNGWVCTGSCQPGRHLCTRGRFGACENAITPGEEVCNGRDDDCDDEIDEGVSFQCKDYGNGCADYSSCLPCPAAPEEVCDGVDNDCNGQTDESFPEEGLSCSGSGVGECQGSGSWICQSGALVCSGEVTQPTPEVCDGKDNDCNGAIDDNVSGEGQPCGETTEGECKAGQTQCIGGEMVCVGEIGPQPEICDGKDNDCDGRADEDAECPAGSDCVEGACLVPCSGGEFACPGGSRCIEGYCIPDACVLADCKETERCVEGNCVEKCVGVDCDPHERCESTSGRCVDNSCVTQGCPTGRVCIAYQCVDDPCAAAGCRNNQQCSVNAEGKATCYELCFNVECPGGQRCVQGTCSSDPCDNLDCPENTACEVDAGGQATCETDPCRLVNCPPGQICRGGECLADPCMTTRCPSYMRCELSGSGRPTCAAIPGQVPQTSRLLATGAGGCGCHLEDGRGPGADWGMLWPLVIAGLLIRRRRRRGEVRR